MRAEPHQAQHRRGVGERQQRDAIDPRFAIDEDCVALDHVQRAVATEHKQTHEPMHATQRAVGQRACVVQPFGCVVNRRATNLTFGNGAAISFVESVL